jgi:hypothetical protein
VSEKSNIYILAVVGFATQYHEAVPLTRIDTESIAETMLEIYSSVGFPSDILVTEEVNLQQT